jgi:transcriptional regulator with XRE-family HTH domain
MTEALRDRDIGQVFRLVRQYAGASQTQLAIACGTTQGNISDIMRDVQRVTAHELLTEAEDAGPALVQTPTCGGTPSGP